MSKSRSRLALLLVMIPALLLPMNTNVEGAANPYKVEVRRWRAIERQFDGWQRAGAALTSQGTLQLDPQKAEAGTDSYRPGRYRSGNFYNGSGFLVGEATGPVVTTGFSYSEAIASWNAVTPPGTWLEVRLRARLGTRWSKWYNMGVWASDQGTVARHSVSEQADADAYVDVDTLKIGRRSKPLVATAYQVRLRLFSTSQGALPSVSNVSVAVSTTPAAPIRLAAGNPARWGKTLDVPECSQMVYPDGGEVWCSPTSVAMVLGYWSGQTGSCETAVRSAVSGVYDRVYRGHGNWPFNTAYAAGQGFESYVTRFTSMAQAEEWIASGVPVIISVGWGRNQLAGAPIPTSNGHLEVIVGFDDTGNPIVNDPAAPGNETVQRTYPRAQLQRLWLQRSGGTAYLIFPAGKRVPRP
jgi:hypothetical protein